MSLHKFIYHKFSLLSTSLNYYYAKLGCDFKTGPLLLTISEVPVLYSVICDLSYITADLLVIRWLL